MKKKLALQVIIKLIAVAVGIISSRWLNEYLSSDQRSLFTTVSAISIFVVGIIEFGLPRLIQKYFTNIHDQQQMGHYWSTIWLVRLFSLALAIPILLISNSIFKINDFWLLFSLFLTQFILISDQNFRGLLDAKGKGFIFSITDLVGKLTLIAGLYFLVSKVLGQFGGQMGIWTFAWSAGIGYGLSLGLDWFFSRKIVSFKSPKWSIIQDNYKQIGLLTLASLVATTYVRTDVLYLNWFGADGSMLNGYDNAFKLYEVATVAPGVLIPTIASQLKKLIDEAKTKIEKKKLIQKYLVFSGVFGLGCTSAVWILGNLGLWLTGASSRYPLATQYLPILALSLVCIPTVILISNLFIFFGREKLETQSVIAVATFSFVSYSVLVSRFGGLGASWANVSLLCFDLCVKLFLFWKYIWQKI